ncbi:TIGR03503 family protein [Glaciecola siphonariae]|uniref:TIGR03503 family protein n=1 Tax=Glaciecola siphonariae TaxID=521012 RepID=A0ABV9LSK0_9ALTE
MWARAWIVACFCVALAGAAGTVKAQQADSASETPAQEDVTKLDAKSVVEKIRPIGSAYQNSISLLNNRFRIDSDVDKVILVFFRQFGAKPVVLVQPDGSKLFLDNDPNDDSYHWYESDTYDMIELDKPMAGPWQALGEILPNSQVMVIADLVLESDAIPSPVFSGETIKHTAYLKNAGERVNFAEFRDVVSLSIDFMSTNHPDHENFGLGTKNIARFDDDGIGLDETPGDGTFTGEFDLNISNGEWQPVISVRTPLFSREQIGENILLLPNPIVVTHVAAAGEEGFHTLQISVDSEHIDPASLLIDGVARTPQSDAERFTITDLGEYQREVSLVNAGYGMYRFKMTAFAKTHSGRELKIRVPEYSFVTSEPVIEPAVQEDTASQQAKVAEREPAKLPEKVESPSVLPIVIAVNVFVLLLGALVIYLIADKRKHPDSHLALKALLNIKSLRNIRLKKAAPADKGEASE